MLASSCQPTPVYEETLAVNQEGWLYEDQYSFEITVEDTISLHDMHLDIDHTPDFAYQNTYLNITTSFPKQEDKVERLNIQLAEKNGKWIGKCNSETCKLKVYMLDKFKFADEGVYSFSISQYSREENLKGIQSIGLKVYQNKS